MGNWFKDCNASGFEPLAITSESIQNDINEFVVPEWGPGPFWVRGTNMRWVWIMGMYLFLTFMLEKNTPFFHSINTFTIYITHTNNGYALGNNLPRKDIIPCYWQFPNEFDTFPQSCMVLQKNDNTSKWHYDCCWSSSHGYLHFCYMHT